MKVMAVNKYFYKKGGAEAYFFALNDMLTKNGYDIIPFSMKSPNNLPSEYSNFFIDNIDYDKASKLDQIKLSGKILYSFEASRKISRLCNFTKPDIAHLHNYQHQMSPSIIRALKSHGIPIVNTIHDLKIICPNYKMFNSNGICECCKGHKYYNCLKYRCNKNSISGSLINTLEMYLHLLLGSYNEIDMFITPSLFYKSKFVEFGFDKDKVTYIPNFINIDKYNPCFEASDYFIYFGRLSEEKGIRTLLKSMEGVRDVKLYIAGDGPLKHEVEETIMLKKLNAKYFGHKAGKELEELVSKSKFVVLPSEWYENCPMSILESMAWGKPVLGANIGGIPELVDQNTGMLFEAGDIGDLTEKIHSMLKLDSDLADIGREARNRVEKEFNSETHLEKVINIYNKLSLK